MGAAWRNPKDKDMPAIVEMVKGVRDMGLETCMTLGMLTPSQAQTLAEAGLDYYNHNIDTSPERYGEVITTRSFEDRLDTLENVRSAGINVCCGGIVGMGGLGAIAAILRATAGLDAEQRAELDLVGRVVLPVDGCGAEEEVGEGEVEEGADLFAGPVGPDLPSRLREGSGVGLFSQQHDPPLAHP
jgi:hypothetical protein